jgi:hypothetical protein
MNLSEGITDGYQAFKICGYSRFHISHHTHLCQADTTLAPALGSNLWGGQSSITRR